MFKLGSLNLFGVEPTFGYREMLKFRGLFDNVKHRDQFV